LQSDNSLFSPDHTNKVWHHRLDKGCGAISDMGGLCIILVSFFGCNKSAHHLKM
jgi:hypothetical protein